eukprot:7255113-Alexandrium_andersonii.AAC.1
MGAGSPSHDGGGSKAHDTTRLVQAPCCIGASQIAARGWATKSRQPSASLQVTSSSRISSSSGS